MLKNNQILFIIFILIFTNFYSQNKRLSKEEFRIKIDSLTKIDFLSYNYKYLDKNYKIIIPSDTFQNTIVKHKFYPERIKKYSDSLGIALMAEFSDWDTERIAKLRITYSWQRIAYTLWLNEKESEEMGMKYGFQHPYRFQEYLNDDNKQDEVMKKFLSDLRKKVFETSKDEKANTMNNYDFLNLSFRTNPQMLKDKEIFYAKRQKELRIDAFTKKHKRPPTEEELKNLGTGCGKKDCCQEKKQ